MPNWATIATLVRVQGIGRAIQPRLRKSERAQLVERLIERDGGRPRSPITLAPVRCLSVPDEPSPISSVVTAGELHRRTLRIGTSDIGHDQPMHKKRSRKNQIEVTQGNKEFIRAVAAFINSHTLPDPCPTSKLIEMLPRKLKSYTDSKTSLLTLCGRAFSQCSWRKATGGRTRRQVGERRRRSK